MTKVDRLLVTTENKETWDIDIPILFLGDWCRTDNQKHIWDRMDAIVAQPYGVDAKIKLRDFTNVKVTQEQILPDLVKVLNSYHGTNHSLRFWQILIGDWLQTYLSILINRRNTIIQALKNYNISSAIFLDIGSENFIPKDTSDLHRLVLNSDWNSTLDLKIINSIGKKILPIKVIKKDYLNSEFIHKKAHLKPNLIKNSTQIILKKFVKKSEAFIVSTYLSSLLENFTQLSFGMVPKNWNYRPEFEVVSRSNLILRKKLTDQFPQSRKDIYTELLFDLFPVCYLEGFNELQNRVEAYKWPSKPRFIFTSNNFATDEEFKLYSAIKTAQGVKYFIGQHGNNYGTSAYQFKNEEVVADHFISWGNGNNSNNVSVGFNFKIAGVKLKHNPKGQILFLLNHLPRREFTWDVYAEHALYFEEQINFIKALENETVSMIKIRLHPAHKQIDYYEKEKLLLANSRLLFDDQKKSFYELLKESRLVVHSYDSTGILESLALNIPTLAFWQNGLNHLNESARHSYEALVNVGIFHLSPESIAQMVNKVSNDVDYWWNQKSIQTAREQFCDQYSLTSKKPIRDLRKILKGNV